MRSKTIAVLLATVAILALLWAAGSAIASPPREGPGGEGGAVIATTVGDSISYQGQLTDPSTGDPLDGTYTMGFQFYDAQSGGTMLWDSGPQSVSVDSGLFNVELDVDQDDFNGQALWLEVAVGSETLTPRQELLPVPYALSLRPGAEIKGESDEPVVKGENTGHGDGAHGIAGWYGSIGVYGESGFGIGVKGQGEIGVSGQGSVGPGVEGRGGPVGVSGHSADGAGIMGTSDNGRGVYGQSDSGTGVYGESTNGEAVHGISISGPGGYFTSTNSSAVVAFSDLSDGVVAGSNSHVGVRASAGTVPLIYPVGLHGVYAQGQDYGVHGWGGQTGGSFIGSVGVMASGNEGIHATGDITGVTGIGGMWETGVYGYAPSGIGVKGVGDAGVIGEGITGVYGDGLTGVHGVSDSYHGVLGETNSADFAALKGENTGHGDGVHGIAGWYGTIGVYGESGFGIGVKGQGEIGVSGQGSVGPGVEGRGGPIGISGRSDSGAGVYGVSVNGIGVVANSESGNLIEAWDTSPSDRRFYVSNGGHVYADGAFHPWGADIAEMLPAIAGLEPGDVLVIGPDGKLACSSEPYDTNVVGVYSTQPGFVGGAADNEDLTGKVPLAVVGVVPVKASAENGPIKPADLLTASPIPGRAMRADHFVGGAIIGKALEGLDEGIGLIKMLVMLQ